MNQKNKELHRWMHGLMDIPGSDGVLHTPAKIKNITRRTLREKNSDPAEYASFTSTMPSVFLTQDYS